MDYVDHRDKLALAMPLVIFPALPPPSAVPGLIHGLSLGLSLVFAEDCLDGLLAGGMACCEVEQLSHCSWFVASKLVDKGLIDHARDECSDDVCIYDVDKLIALLGKAANVLA